MERFFPLVIMLFFSSELTAQEVSYPEQERSSFELIIEGIEVEKGEIRIAVFDSKKAYNKKEHPVYAVVVPVEGSTLIWADKDLLYGDYAIAVYHDKNLNGELDSNMLGIPKEAYGFSNNARGRFGPASWNDAHFEVSSENYSMIIQVK